MPVIVGDGTGAGVEGKSDRIGIPTGSSDPTSAEVGDLYFNIPNSTLKIYNGVGWEDLGAGTIAPNGSSSFPAVSAAQLLSDYPNLNSGVYYLQTSGGSVQVYCEMERMGGGWVIPFQHQCVNDQGLYETLFTNALLALQTLVHLTSKEQDLSLVHNSGIIMLVLVQKLWYTPEKFKLLVDHMMRHMHMLVAMVEPFLVKQIFKTYLILYQEMVVMNLVLQFFIEMVQEK